jgi:hypothetical protein
MTKDRYTIQDDRDYPESEGSFEETTQSLPPQEIAEPKVRVGGCCSFL